MDPTEDEKVSTGISTEQLLSVDIRHTEGLMPSILKHDQPRIPIREESIGESMEELDYEDEKELPLTTEAPHISLRQDMHTDLGKNLCDCKDLSTDIEPMFICQCIHLNSEKNLSCCKVPLSKNIEPMSDHLGKHFNSEENTCSNNSQLLMDADIMTIQQNQHCSSEENHLCCNNQLNTDGAQIGTGKKECSENEIEEGEAEDDESVDVEEGEIEDVSINDNLNKYSCRFYQRGRCIWGKGCRFLHLSDKGLYNMFDSFATEKKIPPQPSFFRNEAKFNSQPFFEPEERSESIWDRALCEAKERIKQSRIRKDECFDKDKLYMSVENSDRFIDKSEKLEHVRAKAVSPVSTSKRTNFDFTNRMDFSKPDRQIYINETVKPKFVKTYGIKSGYHSAWRDPWRRSKTPPKRKRIPSKSSISSKSSLSRDGSPSSSETASRCRSPIPKHLHRSYSRSRPHRRLPPFSRSLAESSCSCSSSTSSRSSESKTRRLRSGKRKRSSHSFSPVYKRKDSRSPRLVLPYKRRSPSESPVKTSRKVHLRKKSVERKHSRGSFSSVSRSHSLSSKSSTKEKQPRVEKFSSDMSISPLSGSSRSRKSESSDRDFNSPLIDVVPQKNRTCASAKDSRLAQGQCGISFRVSSGINLQKQSCELGSKVPAKLESKKKMSALEMELLKYQGVKHSSKLLPVKTASAKAKSFPSNPKLEASSESAVAKSSQIDVKPSKRDLLMRQLQAVEEAIARKRKYCSM